MSTTRAPKSGPYKITHRGMVFEQDGEAYETIDAGPYPASIWAVRVGTQEAYAFKLHLGGVSYRIPADRVRTFLGAADRGHDYRYGDPVRYVPLKLCTPADFK